MDLQLRGHRVLITAGASGIGLAISEAFLSEGARVHVCDVDELRLKEFAQSHPQVTSSLCDVSDRTQVQRLFDDVLGTDSSSGSLGGLDCLVNNAGIAGPTGEVAAIEPDAWDQCIAVNLTGQFNCARLAIAALKDSDNPSIMNLSSLAGRMGFAMRAPYAASKWGVIGLTKSLAQELGEHRIRVNALLPGIVSGERQHRVLSEKAVARGVDFAAIEKMAFASTAIKDYVTPEQLADMVLYTASLRAATISGQALSVCGDTNMLS